MMMWMVKVLFVITDIYPSVHQSFTKDGPRCEDKDRCLPVHGDDFLAN